jgi:hypothetical protein
MPSGSGAGGDLAGSACRQRRRSPRSHRRVRGRWDCAEQRRSCRPAPRPRRGGRRLPRTGRVGVRGEAALRDADDAVKNAREMGQAAALMLALNHAAIPYTLCGNHAVAAAHAQELVSLAEEKGSLFWKARGMINQGSVLALTGRASDATEKLTSGTTACRSTGGTLWIPFHLPRLGNSRRLGAASAKR